MNKVIRQNTLKAAFDKDKPRPSALDIHRWMDEVLHVPADKLEALQLVGKHNAVFIKLSDKVTFERLLNLNKGQHEYTMENDIKTTVTITDASTECIQVRVLNLPPELPNDKIYQSLLTYGNVFNIHNETWSNRYKYSVPNDIRVVSMEILKPIPSNLTIGGHEAYCTYVGQIQTCHLCGERNHLKDMCPYKPSLLKTTVQPRTTFMMSDLLKPRIARDPVMPDSMELALSDDEPACPDSHPEEAVPERQDNITSTPSPSLDVNIVEVQDSLSTATAQQSDEPFPKKVKVQQDASENRKELPVRDAGECTQPRTTTRRDPRTRSQKLAMTSAVLPPAPQLESDIVERPCDEGAELDPGPSDQTVSKLKFDRIEK